MGIKQYFKFFCITSICIILIGCTTLRIDPVNEKIHSVCIINNKKVTVPEFKRVLEESFTCRSIKVIDIDRFSSKNKCFATVRYSARRSWDIVTFLATIDIKIYRTSDNHKIGELYYHVKNGLNFNKHGGARSKLPKLMNKLFVDEPKCN